MNSEDIERLIPERGLVGALLELDRSERAEDELIGKIAEAASKLNPLLSENDVNLLNRLSGWEFWSVQILVCKVIPLLDSTPGEVMNLVHLFVEKGDDNDLAKNQPNAALLKWFEFDPNRANEVIKNAREGDSLSLNHLVFALQGKGNFQEAFRSAQADGEEQKAGVLALSRMTLTKDQAIKAIKHMLRVADASEEEEAAKLLEASFNIAGIHPKFDRKQLAKSLHRISDSNTPTVIHRMAMAFHRHFAKMIPDEVQSCIKMMLKVDPKNKGTIEKIDSALVEMWKADPPQAGRMVAGLIAQTEARINEDGLKGFFFETKNGDRRDLAKLATAWLLEGDFHVCSTLTSHLSEVNATTPCVDVHPDDLPSSAADQIFVCRKAVGFLFISPMTAASWIVAVLRGGNAEAAEKVADLLFDPLLLNYCGTLKDWLDSIAQTDEPWTKEIRKALANAQELLDGFEAAREIVELEPPTEHRTLVRLQEEEKALRIREIAQEKSVFAKFVTHQTLLYGDESSVLIKDIDGTHRFQTMEMSQVSFRSDIPMGLIYDPTGTEWFIEELRRERREVK